MENSRDIEGGLVTRTGWKDMKRIEKDWKYWKGLKRIEKTWKGLKRHFFPISVWPEERFRRRNARRKHPKSYHKKCVKADGSSGWQGSRDLPASAAYTVYFCRHVFKIWLENFQSQQGHVETLAVAVWCWLNLSQITGQSQSWDSYHTFLILALVSYMFQVHRRIWV